MESVFGFFFFEHKSPVARSLLKCKAVSQEHRGMRYWKQGEDRRWRANYIADTSCLQTSFRIFFHGNFTTTAMFGGASPSACVYSSCFRTFALLDGQRRCDICGEKKRDVRHLCYPRRSAERSARQRYQSCVSRPTRKTDGSNKSNMMQERASRLSERSTYSPAAESKCLSQRGPAAPPVWSTLQKN